MTKRDIRIRRGSFSKGQIERHKNFKKFSSLYEKEHNRGITQRLWVVIIAVVLVVGLVVIGYFKLQEDKEERKFKPPVIEQTDNNDR